MLGAEIERILRQIVFARDQRRRGASYVQRGNIVEALRIPVRRQEAQVTGELPENATCSAW